jgi:hypothetical protein
MAQALRNRADEAAVSKVREDVASLLVAFNPYINFTK